MVSNISRVGSFGLFFTLFTLFCRFLPFIAMAEVKGVLAQQNHQAHGTGAALDQPIADDEPSGQPTKVPV